MWVKPWRYREGFLIGGGLIVAGLMLELALGQVEWEVFAWPFNFYVLLAFIFIICLASFFQGKWYAMRFLGSLCATIPALLYATGLTVVMGLTRQTVDDSWLYDMLSFWPFILIYLYLTFILGLVVLKRLRHLTGWRRDIPFLLNHAGLFIALSCGTLGNSDIQRLKMIASTDEPEWRALDSRQNVVEMPLAIQLRQFIMEEYDDGSPRRFASKVQILTKTGKDIIATVEVNKPIEVNGWKIYQYGYDTAMGRMSRVSILELVRDPWLPVVYLGIFMLLAGAVFIFVAGGRRRDA